MRKLDLVVVFLLAVLLTGIGIYYVPLPPSVGNEMIDQPAPRPQELSLLPPEHAIPTSGLEARVDILDAIDLENPVPATADSIARGDRLYQIYCPMCHGSDARGKVAMAGKIRVPPGNLLGNTTKEQSDGYLYVTIREGTDGMPGEGDSLLPQERWDIVNYLRSLQERE